MTQPFIKLRSATEHWCTPLAFHRRLPVRRSRTVLSASITAR